MDPKDDWTLVRQAQTGDTEAFAVLVTRYQTPVVHFCYRMTGSQSDADDLAQETFLRLFKALPRLRPDAKFSTALFGMARNLTLNFLRDAKRRGRGLHDSLDGVDLDAGRAARPDVQAGHSELRRELERGIAELSVEHREILLMREIQGLDYDAIAHIAGCNKGTVKSRLARAREQLRRRMKARGGLQK